jgi:hypothetical protein
MMAGHLVLAVESLPFFYVALVLRRAAVCSSRTSPRSSETSIASAELRDAGRSNAQLSGCP